MATRPTLHPAVAGQKNKASEYNDNFDLMLNYIDDSIGEAKGYVDDFMPSVSGKSGCFLTNDGTDTNWVDLLASNNTFSGGNTFSGNNTVSGNTTFSGNATFSGTVSIPDSATVGTAVSTSAILKSDKGYVKFGNGIIIQWGYRAATSSAHPSGVSISFATAFSNTNYQIVLGQHSKNSDGGMDFNDFGIASKSTTAVTVRAESTAYQNGISYIAIGY